MEGGPLGQPMRSEGQDHVRRSEHRDPRSRARRAPTSRAPGRLPVKGSGASAAGFQGETPELRPGQRRRLTLRMRSGKYVLLCNLPGHYKAGRFQASAFADGSARRLEASGPSSAPSRPPAPPRGRDAPGPHHLRRARPLLSSHTALLEQGRIVTSSTMSSAPDARGRSYSPAAGAAAVPGFRTGLPRVLFLRSVAVRRRSSTRADGRTGLLPNVRNRGRCHLPSLSAEPATPSGLTVLPRGGPSARIPWAGRGRARRRNAAHA